MNLFEIQWEVVNCFNIAQGRESEREREREVTGWSQQDNETSRSIKKGNILTSRGTMNNSFQKHFCTIWSAT